MQPGRAARGDPVTLCEFIIWVWLGSTISCQGWSTSHYGCEAVVQPRSCLYGSSVMLDPDTRILKITGQSDVATFYFPMEEPGWKRLRWVEKGRYAILEGVTYRRES